MDYLYKEAALNHLAAEDETAEAGIIEQREQLQETVYTEWESVQEEVLQSGDDASEAATQGSMAITGQVFQNVSALAERVR